MMFRYDVWLAVAVLLAGWSAFAISGCRSERMDELPDPEIRVEFDARDGVSAASV